MRRQGSLFLGLILIGLGTIFLLDAMGVWPEDAGKWPGILIVIGVAIAADQVFRREHVSWFAPLLLIGLGTFLLLRDLDLVESEFVWPAILIAGGLALILGTMRRGTVEAGAAGPGASPADAVAGPGSTPGPGTVPVLRSSHAPTTSSASSPAIVAATPRRLLQPPA